MMCVFARLKVVWFWKATKKFVKNHQHQNVIACRAVMSDDDSDAEESSATSAMRRAASAGDAKSLRSAFRAYQAAFYARRGRTQTAEERASTLESRDKGGDGYSLLDQASMAESLSAYEWLVSQGASDGIADVVVRGTNANANAKSDDGRGEFEERLREEHAEDGHDALGGAAYASTNWTSYAEAEREWSSTGVLGDEEHRAKMWAAGERARRGQGKRKASTTVRATEDAERREKRERMEREEREHRRRLEDLRARDAEWRKSVVEASTPKRVSVDEYRKKWRRLERALEKSKLRSLCVDDFPFVTEEQTQPATALRDFLTLGVSEDDRRAKLREEMLRWHPDKFSKYLACAREEDLDEVRERVNAMSQAVREAFKALNA
jgi:hypothetical protein